MGGVKVCQPSWGWTPGRTMLARSKSPGRGVGASPRLSGLPWPEVGVEDGGDSGLKNAGGRCVLTVQAPADFYVTR
jgi:hypothetical protein